MTTRVQACRSRFAPYTGAGDAGHRSAREARTQKDELAAELAREFEVIYRREQPVALEYVRRYVDRETAEDVVEGVFASYWDGYAETPARVFGPDTAYTRASILLAVRNRLRTVRRRRRTREEKERHVRAEITPPLREAAAPDARLAELELFEMVARAVNALPTRQREAFCLVKFDERSYEETAEALGISASTVRQHLMRASERLRAELAAYRAGPEVRAYERYDEDVRVETWPGVE
jgi:RNA polymerase sigma factor (sigma-70 family)